MQFLSFRTQCYSFLSCARERETERRNRLRKLKQLQKLIFLFFISFYSFRFLSLSAALHICRLSGHASSAMAISHRVDAHHIAIRNFFFFFVSLLLSSIWIRRYDFQVASHVTHKSVNKIDKLDRRLIRIFFCVVDCAGLSECCVRFHLCENTKTRVPTSTEYCLVNGN